MPKQETFFEQENGETKIEVLKTYDRGYAREAFRNMDDDAMKHLWSVLEVEKTYDAAELPPLGQPDGQGEEFLWDELLDSAHEHGNEVSFFIVNEIHGRRSESLWVSPDWPSAERFAKGRLSILLEKDRDGGSRERPAE
jgi:hypothetical protein